MSTCSGGNVQDLRQLQVLGDVDQHRAGAAAARDVEGLLDDARDVLRAVDQLIVLDAPACVMPSMSASWNASVPIRWVGTWPVMHTIGVESRYASAMASPGWSRPGRSWHGDADLAGGARVALRHVAGALLVAHEVVADVCSQAAQAS